MKFSRLFFFTLFFLLFLQLLTDFIAAIYAFGLLGIGIPPELGFALLLFSPVILWGLGSKVHKKWVLVILWGLVLLARVVEPMLPTRGRLIVAGVGVAAWLLLWPLLLAGSGRGAPRERSVLLASGLMLATLLSGALRAWGAGLDISTLGQGQWLGVGLVVLAGGLSLLWDWPDSAERPDEEGSAERWGRVVVLSLGLMVVLVLIYFAWAAPYVMARWTAADAWLVLGVMVFAWGIFAWAWVWLPWVPHLSRTSLLLISAALAVTLFGAIYIHQPQFSPSPEAYPLASTCEYGLACQGLLFLMLLFSPVLFLAFQRFVATLMDLHPSPRQLGGAFTMAGLFLLVAIFAHVFTTVYDYIPVIGPFFRNRFAHVYGFVALVLLLTLAATKHPSGPRPSRTLSSMALLLGILLLAGHWVMTPRSYFSFPQDAVTILTYNIQQGYSAEGQKNALGQLALMRQAQPDIIGLQESDTTRIANSNDDIVRYFADHLGMYSYYGPPTAAGTFGIALLSRYPILNPTTFYLYSQGEQVAVLSGDIQVGDILVRVFVTHLGNGGPMIQQQELLQWVDSTPHAVVMGDFNFRPDTPQYALTTQTLLDTWTQVWPDWRDDQGHHPVTKIDHIFITPDLQVLDARYFPRGPSDHPALSATIMNRHVSNNPSARPFVSLRASSGHAPPPTNH